jgi:hypothetical protein
MDDLFMLAMSGLTVSPSVIPSRGDKVRINPEFVEQWKQCRGKGIPMSAYQFGPLAGEVLDAMQSAGLTVLTIKRVTANHHDPAQALTLVEFEEVSKAVWLDAAGRYDECGRCCIERSFDPCPFKNRLGQPFFVSDGVSVKELKTRNTTPGATHCAKCGISLKNVGWHAMQHCPRCEP